MREAGSLGMVSPPWLAEALRRRLRRFHLVMVAGNGGGQKHQGSSRSRMEYGKDGPCRDAVRCRLTVLLNLLIQVFNAFCDSNNASLSLNKIIDNLIQRFWSSAVTRPTIVYGMER